MAGFLWLGSAVPAGHFAAPDGTAGGDGTIGNPWDLQTAMNGGGGAVTAGDTVWLRGGSYTGARYTCALNGTSTNPITFRGYPGERAIVDGNMGVLEPDPSTRVIDLLNTGSWRIVRDIEVINSNTNRYCEPDNTHQRADAFAVSGQGDKLINCFIHDAGEGLNSYNYGYDTEVYGNLIQNNGYFRQEGEASMGVAIDIYPAGGSAVVPVAAAESAAVSNSSPLTFAHNNTGDYLVVLAFTHVGLYTDLSVTYNGVSMTRIQGLSTGSGGMALFGLANPAAGSNNVVVTKSGAATDKIRAEAKSFSNAHQTTVPDAEGSWSGTIYDLPPKSIAATSTTNHLVVDGCYWYNSNSTLHDYAPSGANTIIGSVKFLNGNTNPAIGMSSAAGNASPATTSMAWDWTTGLDHHGHGMYLQSALATPDAVTLAGDATVTSVSNPWILADVGKQIMINGAGAAGGWYDGTISAFNAFGSIEVNPAPTTGNGGSNCAWYRGGKTIRSNVVYGGVGDCTIQAYGTSNASFVASLIEKNALMLKKLSLGGNSGFLLRNTTVQRNSIWSTTLDAGFNSQNLTGLQIVDNRVHNTFRAQLPAYWYNLVIGASGQHNVIVGTTENFDSGDFPENDYYTLASPPVTNVVVVDPNVYESNRANVIVYNWEDLDNVDVDLSSAVTVGTPIRIVNAQDYFNPAAVVYEGVYAGGTVSLPMDGLTAATAVGEPWPDGPPGPTGRAFNCFIVRAQSMEPSWR